MARKGIPTLPDPQTAQEAMARPVEQEPLPPGMEQSWVPPALLLDGVMVASLRGLRKLPLDDISCRRLYTLWLERGRVALSSTEVVDALGWPKEDRP